MRERCRGSWSWHERCSSPRMRIRKPFLALSIYALVGCGGASPVDGGDQSPPGSIVSSGDDLRCVGRFCPRQCPPGATQCLGDILRVCDSSGHWQTEMECLGSCIAGACTECSRDSSGVSRQAALMVSARPMPPNTTGPNQYRLAPLLIGRVLPLPRGEAGQAGGDGPAMSAHSSLHRRGMYERALEKADIGLRPAPGSSWRRPCVQHIILNGQTSMPRTFRRGPLSLNVLSAPCLRVSRPGR